MKKIRLNIEYEIPAEIIGISSSYKDFQIAWTINNSFNISLVKFKEIPVKRKNIPELLYFSVFSFVNYGENDFFLVSNKYNGINLYSKLKNIDFFLIIKSEHHSNNDILKKLNNSNFIIGCFKIQTNNSLKKIFQIATGV